MRAVAVVVVAILAGCASFAADGESTSSPEDAGARSDGGGDATLPAKDASFDAPVEGGGGYCGQHRAAFCSSFDGVPPFSWPKASSGLEFGVVPSGDGTNAWEVTAGATDVEKFVQWSYVGEANTVTVRFKLNVAALPTTDSSDALLVQIKCPIAGHAALLKLRESGHLQIQDYNGTTPSTDEKMPMNDWRELSFAFEFQKEMRLTTDLLPNKVSLPTSLDCGGQVDVSLGFVEWHEPHSDTFRVRYDDVTIDVEP